MKTFLVNPSDNNILEHSGDRAPLGLMSIASNNKNCEVFDLNHYDENKFINKVETEKPYSVGISVYTSPMYNSSVKLAQKLKGKTKLIAGGYHATAMPESLTPYFDSVIIGEGENLLESANRNYGVIKGPLPDLNKLENPSGLELSVYGINQSDKKTGTIISSRGCPFHCAFCGKLSDELRYTPIDKVLSQVENYKKNGFEAIYFTDDVFTANKERMKNIVEKLDIPFRITTRANMLNNEKADILSYNNCDWASFGIESGNNEILKYSNKQMTKEQNENAIKLMSDRGIKTKGFFIIGLPGETEKSAKQTIDFSKHLKDVGLTTADFYYLTPFPGTPIWNNPDKFGIEITDRNFSNYLQAGKGAKCVINTKELKSSRIEELVNEAKSLWKN